MGIAGSRRELVASTLEPPLKLILSSAKTQTS